jgi:hypothetical protein
MDNRKECFGSITETDGARAQTFTQTKPECQDCQEIRDCLRQSKQRSEEKRENDELRKQEMIAWIIDISIILSNDIGSCLLEFLSRIYSIPLGQVLFKNLLLFYEVPRNKLSSTLTIPISRSIMNLILGEGDEEENPASFPDSGKREANRNGFVLRAVLIQKSFPNNRKANMGLIAYEVARMLTSDKLVIQQILPLLSDNETKIFKNSDPEQRTRWLIGKWRLLDELEALKKELAPPGK